MRRSLGRLGGFAAASIALLLACALPSSDEFASGTPDGGTSGNGSSSGTSGTSGASSSGASEAGVDSGEGDAGEAGTGGAPLFTGGDFEGNACTSAMYTFQSAAGTTQDAHAGATACQTCREAESQTYYSIVTRPLVTPPVIGATYHARVWVKVGASSFKDQQVQVGVRVANNPSGNFSVVEEHVSGFVDLKNDWQLLETSLTVTKDGEFVDTYVAAQTLATAGERCLILDDLAIVVDAN